jgi:CheY-like chemotaxis protein
MFPSLQILMVEDVSVVVKEVSKILADIDQSITFTSVESHDEAIEKIQSDRFFDLAILDLKIPKIKGSLDIDDSHGMSVLATLKEKRPGTLVLVLSGSNNPTLLKSFLNASSQEDIWAEGNKRPTIFHIAKEEFQLLEEWLIQVNEAVKALHSVELDLSSLGDGALPYARDRLIRSFLKSRKILSAKVSRLGGGLSDSDVFRIDDVIKKASFVAKCGLKTDIDLDSNNFDQFISHLPSAATPRLLGKSEFGGADQSAVFYGMEQGFGHSYFECIRDGILGAEIAEHCRSNLSNWWGVPEKNQCSVSSMRKLFLKDADFEVIKTTFELDWLDSFEAQTFISNYSTIHADLHGENVLVSQGNATSVIIDYGDIKDGPSAYDPITFECCVFFHPGAQGMLNGWPSIDQLNNWDDTDSYLVNCPIESHLKTCRDWLNEVSFGKRDQAACLYAYALRQLKFPNTDKDFAFALLGTAQRMFKGT